VRRGSGTSVIVATVSREPVKSECILNIIHRLYRYIHYQFSDYTSEKINYYTLVISVWVVKYRVYVVSFLFFLIFFFPFLCFSPPNTCGVSCAWMLVCDAVGLRARVCVCVYTLHMSRVSSVYERRYRCVTTASRVCVCVCVCVCVYVQCVECVSLSQMSVQDASFVRVH